MFESALYKPLLAVLSIILVFTFLKCASGRKNVRTLQCSDNSTLSLTVEKVFVELSYQSVYDLSYKKNSDKTPRMVTGNISVLPTAKRYRDMISVRDFLPGKPKSVFQHHYLFPSEFTSDEFNEICGCFEKNKNSFPELKNKVGALIHGDYNSFREAFKLPDGFYIVTEYNGNLTIVKDPSREAMTIPAELKNFAHIGYFDDSSRLHLRKGRIVSGEFKGLFERPVKQVLYVTEDGKEDYTGEVDTTFCNILYKENVTGVNSEYLLSAVNDKGVKIGSVFMTGGKE